MQWPSDRASDSESRGPDFKLRLDIKLKNKQTNKSVTNNYAVLKISAKH